MNNLRKWSILCAFLTSASSVLAQSMDGTMPSVLIHDAIARGCEPVKEFYDRAGITLPPFFFEEQSENREYAAAYLCEREHLYFLVFPPIAGSTCKQRELALGGTMPGGLSAFARRLPLSMFRRIGNSRQISKGFDAAEAIPFRPLVIDYDGVQRVFYCSEGEWLEARLE